MTRGTAALFTRSLRLDARSLRAHLLRLLCAACILGILLYARGTGRVVGAPGLAYFGELIMFTAVLITLAGISYFATAITEEKEDGTLGLLRMAGISPVALLLGKSTSRMTIAVLVLAVQFPFTLLAVTLGGVTVHQVLAAYAVLLAYMVLVANLALVASVWCSRSGGATLFAMLLISAISVGPAAYNAVFGTSLGPGISGRSDVMVRLTSTVSDWLGKASIFRRLSTILTTGFAEPFIDTLVLGYLFAALFCFCLAWLTFDWFTGTEDVSSPGRRAFEGRGWWRSVLGTGRAWRFALAWKDFHFITGGATWMVVKFIAYGAIVAGIGYYGFIRGNIFPGAISQDFGGFVMLAMLISATAELCVYASWIFHDELKWKTLTGISVLPRSLGRITAGKVSGCLLALVPAAFYLVAFGALFAPASLWHGLCVLFTTSAGLSILLQFALFLHLTVFVSLFVRWGALPLSIAIALVLGMCVYSPFVAMGQIFGWITGNEVWNYVQTNLVAVGLLIWLQWLIAERLQRLAAE